MKSSTRNAKNNNSTKKDKSYHDSDDDSLSVTDNYVNFHSNQGKENTDADDLSEELPPIRDLNIRLDPSLPRSIVVNEWLTSKVFLVDRNNVPKPGLRAVEIFPILVNCVTGEQVLSTNDSPVLNVELADNQDRLEIGDDGMGIIKFQITELSKNRNNAQFTIQINFNEQEASAAYPNLESPSPYISSPFFTVRYRLLPTNDLPAVWFKDQGGRDKAIELGLSLVSETNALVKDMSIPLKATLLYDDDTTVRNQGILRLNSDSKSMIDSKTGLALLKFRIEDVSKNHQSKPFVLFVEPDTSKNPLLFFEVAGTISSPIIVRSKKNRDKKVPLKPNPASSGRSGGGTSSNAAAVAGTGVSSSKLAVPLMPSPSISMSTGLKRPISTISHEQTGIKRANNHASSSSGVSNIPLPRGPMIPAASISLPIVRDLQTYHQAVQKLSGLITQSLTQAMMYQNQLNQVLENAPMQLKPLSDMKSLLSPSEQYSYSSLLIPGITPTFPSVSFQVPGMPNTTTTSTTSNTSVSAAGHAKSITTSGRAGSPPSSSSLVGGAADNSNNNNNSSSSSNNNTNGLSLLDAAVQMGRQITRNTSTGSARSSVFLGPITANSRAHSLFAPGLNGDDDLPQSKMLRQLSDVSSIGFSEAVDSQVSYVLRKLIKIGPYQGVAAFEENGRLAGFYFSENKSIRFFTKEDRSVEPAEYDSAAREAESIYAAERRKSSPPSNEIIDVADLPTQTGYQAARFVLGGDL